MLELLGHRIFCWGKGREKIKPFLKKTRQGVNKLQHGKNARLKTGLTRRSKTPSEVSHS